MQVLDVLASAIAAGLWLPALVYVVEIGAAWVGKVRAGHGEAPAAPPASFVVLVPAHDESAILGDTLDALKSQLGPNDRILVVADNCSDDTAAIARGRGVGVVERVDPDRRGKGFAISHGLSHLAADPPEVLVIVDADSRVGGAGLEALAAEAKRRDRPIQAEYLIHPPEDASPLARISAFALVVRNRVRPLGLEALGLPVHLMGSGMAFPWKQIREAPAMGSELVEDLAMGIALAGQGHAPRFFPAVAVTSELPERAPAAATQRTRWEHGQLATLLRHGPTLILRGLATARRDLVALGLDLITPPLALLVTMLLGLGVLLAGGTLLGLSPWPAILAFSGVAAVGLATLCAWWAFGRETISLLALSAAPFYVLWKLPIYLGFLHRRQESWVRTQRAGEETSPGGSERG